MKNLKLGLCIIALLSLIYLFTPCVALAQQDGPVPRPSVAPTVGISLMTIGAQSPISWVESRTEVMHAQPVLDPLSPVALTAASRAISMPAMESRRRMR
jgi:hypothetical protein